MNSLPGCRFVCCGVVFFLCRASAFSMSIGLSAGPDPWRVWRRTLRGHLAHHLSFLAFGAAAALLYLKTGPWGLALLVVPAPSGILVVAIAEPDVNVGLVRLELLRAAEVVA